jgi:NADPH:quinone reductase-like Zn-dependent oxidoreductase
VIATAGGSVAAARAEAVVDHYAEDVVKTVKGLTDGRGVDIVIDHVGEKTWDRSVRCLARGGRLVTCGATTGHGATMDLRHLFARQLSLLGSYMGAKDDLLRAADLFFAALAPGCRKTFPCQAAQPGHLSIGAVRQRCLTV